MKNKTKTRWIMWLTGFTIGFLLGWLIMNNTITQIKSGESPLVIFKTVVLQLIALYFVWYMVRSIFMKSAVNTDEEI